MSSTFARIAALFTSVLSLTGCSGVDILNASVPNNGYQVIRDITYAEGNRHNLDIYVPDGAHHAPVILFYYGGSWQMGNKKMYKFVGQAFASRGFVTVIADYRLYPEVYYPDFIVDSAKALKWTHEHIGEYGGDASNLFVAGHSAGGFNAVMLTLNDQYLAEGGAKRSWIRGAIGIAGPYDFLPLEDPKIIQIFSKYPGPQNQPINYVHGKLPPFFLATGEVDEDVLPKNTHNLAKKLREHGTRVVEKTYPDVQHIGIVLSLARGFRGRAPLLDDITDFVNNPPAK